jgi:dolichol-phosphate mannosyltransferase
LPLQDLTGGYNGFRREALQGMGLGEVTSSGYCFQIDLKYRALGGGFQVTEAPILFPDRFHGQSKMSSRIFLEAITQVWKLRMRSGRPGQRKQLRYSQLPPA